MGSARPLPRRHGALHFLMLGSLLYALVVLGYSALNVHSGSLLPAVQLTRLLDAFKLSLRHVRRSPEQQQADDHALQVGVIPSGETTQHRLKCVGWRATADCRPDGPRLPELDRLCTKTIPHGQSGYCELQDEDSGELFKVARRTCADVAGKAALFRCLEAPRFANYHVLAYEAVERALKTGFTLPNVESGDAELQDGIVMVVYPKMVPSTPQFEWCGRLVALGIARHAFVDMFEQESGQLLIDRRRHVAPLELLRFFTFHKPNPFVQLKLVWGDKDLFRLAWLKLDVPFHMIQSPPAVAGKVVNGTFCGMTMVQHDAKGGVLFLHRNSHKLTGGRIRNPADEKNRTMRKEARVDDKVQERNEDKVASSTQPSQEYPDAAIWTHLLSFRSTSPRSEYQIETYHTEYSKDQICYGQQFLDANENFYAQEFASMSFSGLETHLRRFAMEAGQLHQARVDAIARKQQLQRKPFRVQAATDV
ncbi:unnamed protein product [Phytophthora lilii]|uniref:Unnamed protein product n=1 Tax=Phytophthora lilii TaxID=2077276 RepID=A0A9W6U3U0_9STRA|nr:unnamed protein product [Phytophthora lilii]